SEIVARLPVRAERIVALALLRVAQDFVGLVDGLDLLLGLGTLSGRHDVGMVLAGQLAEGAANLVRLRRARDAEDLVVVAEFHGAEDTASRGFALRRTCAGRIRGA